MPNLFSQSNFRFHDPIRYFKANDPYYWEVDNIPLKQLQENCNFLREQVESLAIGAGRGTSSSTSGSVTRADIDELKPYVNGQDNVVRVRPGKFTARINDAYTLAPLQLLSQVGGIHPSFEPNTWSFKTNLDDFVKTALDKFKSSNSLNPTYMNGLFERIFTYPIEDNDSIVGEISTTSPYSENTRVGGVWNHPNFIGRLHAYQASVSSITSVPNWQPDVMAMEGEFIKKWRGIARTAIVSVEEELTLEIPPFNQEDFYYVDESGARTTISDAQAQRIDLVFVYAKSIDMPTTTIKKAVGDSFVSINKPVLGIVKGAGIGVNLNSIAAVRPLSHIRLTDADGNPLILPNVSDRLINNTGIGGIKGSFPSPDDLMNLAPFLAESLESNNISLIGQSILPVAYVLVTSGASTIIPSSNVMDIRPFFRTTELTYNERSGMAAAVPAPSLANPVATESYVDTSDRLLSERLTVVENFIASQNQSPTGSTEKPRVVYSGYILGGTKWGVESTLLDYVRKNNGGTLTTPQLIATTKDLYGYPSNVSFRDNPDWDIATWVNNSSYTDKGSKIVDYLNRSVSKIQNIDFNATDYWYGSNTNQAPIASYKGVLSSSYARHNIMYVSKTFTINMQNTPWVDDIKVNVRLLNCTLLTNVKTMIHRFNHSDSSTASHMWVSKKLTSGVLEVTIFVSLSMDDNFFGNEGVQNTMARLRTDNATHLTNSVVVITKDMNNQLRTTSGGGHLYREGTKIGAATYPSVEFEIIGIPESYGGHPAGFNPIIVLN